MRLMARFKELIEYVNAPLLVNAEQARNELREEIEFHLTSSARDQMESGLSAETSTQIAKDRFGDVGAVVRECDQVFGPGLVFWHRLHQCMTVALIAAVGLLGWHVLGLQKKFADTNLITATGYSVQATDGDVRGDVIGDDGQPVSSAHVLAVVKSWPPNGYRQQSYMTTTHHDGTFQILDVYSPDNKYEVQISVIADGRLLSSEYTNMQTGRLDPYHFQLEKTPPFEIRFESEDGNPISGVAAFPSSRIDTAGKSHSVYGMAADPIVRLSNENGEINMPHFLPGEKITVSVRFPSGQWQRRELVVPESNRLVVMRPATDSVSAESNF